MAGHHYEVFQGSPAEPLWLESLDSLEAASLRMRERAKIRPGPYFLYCTDSGRILETIDTSSKDAPPQINRLLYIASLAVIAPSESTR